MNGLRIVLEQHVTWTGDTRQFGAGAWQPASGSAPEGQEMAEAPEGSKKSWSKTNLRALLALRNRSSSWLCRDGRDLRLENATALGFGWDRHGNCPLQIGV